MSGNINTYYASHTTIDALRRRYKGHKRQFIVALGSLMTSSIPMTDAREIRLTERDTDDAVSKKLLEFLKAPKTGEVLNSSMRDLLRDVIVLLDMRMVGISASELGLIYVHFDLTGDLMIEIATEDKWLGISEPDGIAITVVPELDSDLPHLRLVDDGNTVSLIVHQSTLPYNGTSNFESYPVNPTKCTNPNDLEDLIKRDLVRMSDPTNPYPVGTMVVELMSKIGLLLDYGYKIDIASIRAITLRTNDDLTHYIIGYVLKDRLMNKPNTGSPYLVFTEASDEDRKFHEDKFKEDNIAVIFSNRLPGGKNQYFSSFPTVVGENPPIDEVKQRVYNYLSKRKEVSRDPTIARVIQFNFGRVVEDIGWILNKEHHVILEEVEGLLISADATQKHITVKYVMRSKKKEEIDNLPKGVIVKNMPIDMIRNVVGPDAKDAADEIYLAFIKDGIQSIEVLVPKTNIANDFSDCVLDNKEKTLDEYRKGFVKAVWRSVIDDPECRSSTVMEMAHLIVQMEYYPVAVDCRVLVVEWNKDDPAITIYAAGASALRKACAPFKVNQIKEGKKRLKEHFGRMIRPTALLQELHELMNQDASVSAYVIDALGLDKGKENG